MKIGTETYPDAIAAKCPSCGRKLAPMPLYTEATEFFDRTCRGRDCRETWRIKATPSRRRGMIFTFMEFRFLGRKTDRKDG